MLQARIYITSNKHSGFAYKRTATNGGNLTYRETKSDGIVDFESGNRIYFYGVTWTVWRAVLSER